VYRRLSGSGSLATGIVSTAAGAVTGGIATGIISAVTGLLDQASGKHAAKIQKDAAQYANGSLADQSYVQLGVPRGMTRYEYDNAVRPLSAAIASGDLQTLKNSGLLTDAYINSIAVQHGLTWPPMMAPSVPTPAGSSAANPMFSSKGPVASAGLGPGTPDWVMWAGLGAVALLFVMRRRGGKKS